MSSVIAYGINGLSFVLTFLVVHFAISRLRKDRLNIDFSASISIALVPMLLFAYGIPLVDSILSFAFVVLMAFAIWLTWRVSVFCTFLDHRQDLWVSAVGCMAYVFFYEGLYAVWARLLER